MIGIKEKLGRKGLAQGQKVVSRDARNKVVCAVHVEGCTRVSGSHV